MAHLESHSLAGRLASHPEEREEHDHLRGSPRRRARMGMDRQPEARARRRGMAAAFQSSQGEEPVVEDQPHEGGGADRRRRDGRWERAYDGSRSASVPADLAAAFARRARARAFFETLDSANRYAILYRVQTAKKPETRAARIERFVGMCARHETLHPPRRSKA